MGPEPAARSPAFPPLMVARSLGRVEARESAREQDLT